MGEHKLKADVKGADYKKDQLLTKIVRKRRRYIKAAHISDAWMISHGYKKNAEGKWDRF